MKPLKILWALDAFDDLPALRKNIVQTLSSWAKHGPLEIEPVYVLSPSLLGVSADLAAPWSETYAPKAALALQQMLASIELPGLRPPRVLNHLRGSLRSSVEMIAHFAQMEHFDLIVTGSHGQRGLKRLLMGSFAEQLLLVARTPVLVMGAHAEMHAAGSSPRILFANDLADLQSPIIDGVFAFAARLGAKVTLLNVVPHPMEPVIQSGVFLLSGGWVTADAYREQEVQKQQQAAAQVADRARLSYGVSCDVLVEDSGKSVTETILDHASDLSQVDFIAMAAESGPLSAALVGSVTRQVVRAAKQPVMVFRKG